MNVVEKMWLTIRFGQQPTLEQGAPAIATYFFLKVEEGTWLLLCVGNYSLIGNLCFVYEHPCSLLSVIKEK